jgi:ADP-ribosylglycohydrolase
MAGTLSGTEAHVKDRYDTLTTGDKMLGAIAGDVIGSVHEHGGTKTKNFPLFTDASCFTDDTVLTIAVADALLNRKEYVDCFHEYFHAYPDAGYGGSFLHWAWNRHRHPYNSYGNGSAMRVSPVAYPLDTLEEVLDEARRSAEVTHNHPEGIRGAQATAAAVFLARTGAKKAEIKTYVADTFSYDLNQDLDVIRQTYAFDVSCQGSVPQSIVAFLAADGFEDAVRNAISLGGDADTMACIAGAIAEAFYGGVPKQIADHVMARLDDRLQRVVKEFKRRYNATPRW